MQREIRNLKGEIVQDFDPDERWYHLSASTWLLIGGLVLFNVGCFLKPSVVDSIFRLLDFRLWSWWYYVVALIYIAFAVKWIRIYMAANDFVSDELNEEADRRFKAMSIVVSLELALLVLLHATGLGTTIGLPFYFWIKFGNFSLWAILTFFGIIALGTLALYFLKEWLVTLLPR